MFIQSSFGLPVSDSEVQVETHCFFDVQVLTDLVHEDLPLLDESRQISALENDLEEHDHRDTVIDQHLWTPAESRVGFAHLNKHFPERSAEVLFLKSVVL